MVPKITNGVFDYTIKPNIVTVSIRDKVRRDGKASFLRLPKAEREAIVEFLDFCGVTLEDVQTDYRKRALVNTIFFREVESHRPDMPFKKKHRTFFKDL